MQSYHKLRLALDKLGKGTITTFNETQLNDIATILTLYKGDAKRSELLRNAQIPEQYNAVLLPLSFSKFGNLSIAAMQKLIPLLEQGLRYDEACTQVYGDHRGLHPDQKKRRLSLNDMEDDLTNPVVRRAVSQTIKVINAVVRTYGPPDVVRIELAREMSRSFDERRKMEKSQEDNRAKNERIRQQIVEYKGDRATGLDIVKFKLYEEQNGVCLYSGQNLDISRLFEPGYVDIDHIIPYSRCFDDSYRNKVLVLARENRQKGNRLPYEYFGQDEGRWHAFEARVESLIRDYRKRQKLLKQGLTDAESNDFIERNLKDTQYITKAVYNLIRNHLEFADSKYNQKNASPVYPVNGVVTSMLRNRWGVQKIREDGDLHHCLDAAVVAATSPALTQRLTEYHKRRETLIRTPAGYADPATGELVDDIRDNRIPEPWSRFRQELEARLSPDPREQIDRLKLSTYESDESINPVFASRMPNHKVTGAAHAETIRSSKAGEGTVVSKVPLSKLSLNKDGQIVSGNAEYYNPASDILLYNAIVAQLRRFGGDGAKAFTNPFYKPKSDGTPGPRVDKVKVIEKSTVNLPVRNGAAANGSMVRIDVFYVEDDGYYFIPIYVADTKKKHLPTRAVRGAKPYSEWKEMDDRDFIFSLYAGDLVRIRNNKPVKLNLAKGGTGAPFITQTDGMYYYQGANIATGQFRITTHDRRYEQPSLGVKTLRSIEKYQVDILGNYYPVRSPEKRMPFRKED